MTSESSQDDDCWRFMGANLDLPIAFEPGVWIRFRVEGPRIRMVLEFLNTDVRIDDLRDNWHIVAEWQRRLIAWQGPPRPRGYGNLYNELDYRHEVGESYQELADDLNQSVVGELREYLGGGDYSQFGLDRARLLLDVMQISEKDAKVWCDAMLSNLREGRPAFELNGGPITRDKVIQVLRELHRKNKRTGKG